MRKSHQVVAQWILAIQETGQHLTKWELDFIEDVAEQFDERGTVSDRQEEIIERIYAEKTP
jgi:uncharacterized membrane-anchored protein